MLKKLLAIACMVSISCTFAAKAKKKTPKKEKYTYVQRYILMDYNSDMIIDENGKDDRVYPSSMTKLLTLYILFSKIESGELALHDTMVVSKKARNTGGSRSWLLEGSNVSIEDLIRCIIVHSGNDAAVVVAENISGSMENFAELMNTTAQNLGMKNSHFMNSNGLPDDNHYSTVYDLALLSKRIIRDFPEFYHYFSEKEFEMNKIRQPNRNTLLWDDIGVDGLKTGHTDKGGYGLAASAEKGGVRLISVVNGFSNPKGREIKTKELLTRGFRSIVTYSIAQSRRPVCFADVWLGTKESVPLVTYSDVKISIPKNEVKNLKVFASYKSPVKAPIKKGDHVADLVIECGNLQQSHKLYATEDVQELDVFNRALAALKFMVFGRSTGN